VEPEGVYKLISSSSGVYPTQEHACFGENLASLGAAGLLAVVLLQP